MTELVAHRGASGLAPENTLPALAAAAALSVRWVEVDVQRTADDIPVLVHDDSWLRTTGRDLDVRATPWETVRKLDAGGWFGESFRNTPPPRLDDALQRFPNLCFNLEIKSPERDAGLGEALVAVVAAAGAGERVLISSFDADCIAALADRHGQLRYAWLSEKPLDRQHPRVVTHVLSAAAILAAPRCVEDARRRGCDTWAWTVDDPSVAGRLLQFGVRGVITNRPDRLLSLHEDQRRT